MASSFDEDASANIATHGELSLVSANIAASSTEDASPTIAIEAELSLFFQKLMSDASANITSSSTVDASANIASSCADASENNALSSSDNAAAGTSPRMIILKSVEGETLEVEEAVAFKSETIKKLIENNSADISLNVTTCTLTVAIKYCKRLVETAAMASGDTDEELMEFYAEFVQFSTGTMFEIISAAKYLGIPSLMNLACQYMADYIKERSPEEVREIFNIEDSGFSEEEEKLIRLETAWTFM